MVMLGCASEKAFLNVVDSYTAALTPTKRSEFEKNNQTLKRKYDSLKPVLEAEKRDLKTATDRDDWDIMFDPIFHIIRRHRNEQGHPISFTPDIVAVKTGLLLFPELYMSCEILQLYFKAKVSAPTL